MIICGQHFSNSDVEQIQSVIHAQPLISRRELSRQVCDLLNWRFADGRFKDMSCRKAFLALGRRGVLELPQKKQPNALAKPRRRPEGPEIPAIQCELAQLGEVTVFPVTSRYSKTSRDWQGMMATHHYLGGGPLCGAQIRYLVTSSTHGYLGALAFSALQGTARGIG